MRIFPHLKCQGISLIELVVIIVMVAILSVVVGPKLLTPSSANSYALRDEFIAQMRQVQLMAMNNTDRCYSLNVTKTGYQTDFVKRDILTNSCINDENSQLGSFWNFPRGTSLNLITESKPTAFILNFDQLGKIKQCPTNTNKCIQVNGGDTLPILVESEGYIHAQ